MASPRFSITLPRTRREAVSFVAAEFEACNLPIPTSSRFELIERLYSQSTDRIDSKHAHYELALEAERDLHTLAFVFDELRDCRSDPVFLDLLKTVHSDSTLPQMDRENSDGRNSQFHLMVAAICSKAGMKPRFAEPDLITEVASTQFSIAVKRTRNLNRVQEHLRKAAKQIHRAGLPGLIAIDLSIALNRENVRPDVEGIEDLYGEAFLENLKNYAVQNQKQFWEWVRGTNVRGIIFHVSCVTHAKHGDASFLNFNFGLSTELYNRRREEQFLAFYNRFKRGYFESPRIDLMEGARKH